MGYLDNSTIVVDAVLTKQGRQLLASGQGLNVKYFTLSDTGIDYTLWNPDHPSGSAYYGEAIENLPNLEALPNAAYFLRNNLITLNKATTVLPYIMAGNAGIGQDATLTWEAGSTVQNTTRLLPLQLQPGNIETQGWSIVVPDNTLFTSVTGDGITATDFSGNAQQYLNDQEIQNAVLYTTQVKDPTIVFSRMANNNSERSTTVTILSNSTGAYKHVNITIAAWVSAQ